jgi:hypothetical protein
VALPSEPSSHAALLQTQLRQHEGALQDLKVMRDQLTKHLESAGGCAGWMRQQEQLMYAIWCHAA